MKCWVLEHCSWLRNYHNLKVCEYICNLCFKNSTRGRGTLRAVIRAAVVETYVLS